MNTSDEHGLLYQFMVGPPPRQSRLANVARSSSDRLRFDSSGRALNNKLLHISQRGEDIYTVNPFKRYYVLCQGDPLNVMDIAPFIMNLPGRNVTKRIL